MIGLGSDKNIDDEKDRTTYVKSRCPTNPNIYLSFLSGYKDDQKQFLIFFFLCIAMSNQMIKWNTFLEIAL